MGIYKKEVRPDLDGLLDCVDAVNDVHSKITPLLTLIVCAGETLSKEELCALAGLIEDVLQPAWDANEEVYRIYREKKGKGGQL